MLKQLARWAIRSSAGLGWEQGMRLRFSPMPWLPGPTAPVTVAHALKRTLA